MKAYLIDPFAKTVTEVEYDGDFKTIRRLIGASLYDACRFSSKGDAAFVDDEGLLKPVDEQRFFMLSSYPEPLAGKALVLGQDRNGDSAEPSITLEQMRDMVTFERTHTMRSVGGFRIGQMKIND